MDIKYKAGSTIGFTLPLGVYEISDNNLMLKSLLPGMVKVNLTIDDIRRKSNLNNKTFMFNKKSSVYTILGFTESHSGVLGDIPGFVQLIPGSCKGDEPINITGLDEIHLKPDCINGSVVNGTREPILYSFALSSPRCHKIYKEPRIKLFKKINKSILSHITFFLEDDDHKPVDFNKETISFACQLIKI